MTGPDTLPWFWYRCRACHHSRASTWTTFPADLSGAACGSCRSTRITFYELATRAVIRLPRPLVPPTNRWTCCDCGGTGLTSSGDTCALCLGAGFL
ncbi:hypothetical protein [Actinomadura flavalba]|uniref:hypothetical protein n=1 Tax=Actinomadura flavalba TaxID=1120938 RepID=UPI0003810C6B|nr:hypothetical protein [Actinomadura flavalba]